MDNGLILVLGARGRIGSHLRATLAARGHRLRGATRNVPPSATQNPGQDSTDWVEFDLTRPETFGPALAGVEKVFLAARPGDEHSDEVAAPFLEAMRKNGIRQVVNLTAMGTEQRPEFALRRLELALEASGLPFTHLRPNWFFQVFTEGSLLAGIRNQGEIRLPAGAAKISFIDARDVASVAAAIFSQGGFDGRGLSLTGSEAHDHAQVAEAIGLATGRSVSYRPLTEDEARQSLAAAGFPPPWQERLIRFYQLVRTGHCATVTDSVAQITGRAPIPLPQFAREHAEVWRPEWVPG